MRTEKVTHLRLNIWQSVLVCRVCSGRRVRRNVVIFFMPFYDNENIAQLNVELLIIPILVLIILLYITKSNKYKKTIIIFTAVYILWMIYSLYGIFIVLYHNPDAISYFIEYPYGLTFLIFTIFLTVCLFIPNRISSIFAAFLLIIVLFNQIYLRIQTNPLNEEYKAIMENNSDGKLFDVKLDTLDSVFQNLPNDYSKFIERIFIHRTLSYMPYVSLKTESIFNFKFPNYYWTEYMTGETRTIAKNIKTNFVEPKLIEKFNLKPKDNINVFYGLFDVDKDGSIVHTPNFFPDTTNYINYQNYIKSIKFIPGYFEGKPVRVLYHIKFKQ